jgi:hypothetical protein
MKSRSLTMSRLSHNTLESALEPFDGVVLGDLVALPNLGLASSPLCNTGARSIPRTLVSRGPCYSSSLTHMQQ